MNNSHAMCYDAPDRSWICGLQRMCTEGYVLFVRFKAWRLLPGFKSGDAIDPGVFPVHAPCAMASSFLYMKFLHAGVEPTANAVRVETTPKSLLIQAG